ncbi:MAG: hypothetical protein JWQ95_1558 [Sphaerisporangium sp.]|nr:hypothetical protein [Sphaerisporangium sp.]
MLTRHGLFRDDVPNLGYALSATHGGFLLLDNLDPAAAELDVQARADSLAHIVRAAFEPAGQPDPQALAAAAAEVLEVIEGWTRPTTPATGTCSPASSPSAACASSPPASSS